MRIKGSDLKRIIKEEVRRASLREADLDFGFDDNSDAEAKLSKITGQMSSGVPQSTLDILDEPMDATPTPAKPVASMSGPMSSYLQVLRMRQAPNNMMSEAEKLFPTVLPDLDKVFNGDLVVKTGDRGPLVKALQILIFSSISDLQDMMIPQLKSVYLRDEADDAIESLAQGYSIGPTGNFDNSTYTAVVGVQKAMNVIYKLQELSSGGPTDKIVARPAQIDGKIGRQTLQFLMGRLGAAVSGYESPLQKVTKKSMLLSLIAGKSPKEIAKMFNLSDEDLADTAIAATGMSEDKKSDLLDLARSGELRRIIDSTDSWEETKQALANASAAMANAPEERAMPAYKPGSYRR